jgi:hypothetical protein
MRPRSPPHAWPGTSGPFYGDRAADANLDVPEAGDDHGYSARLEVASRQVR